MNVASALLRLIWGLGGCALILGPLRSTIPALGYSPLLENRTAPWQSSVAEGLRSDLKSALPSLPLPEARVVGTASNDPAWMGRIETGWIPVSRLTLRVYVAGFPLHSKMGVYAEFRGGTSETKRIDCNIPDPGANWSLWTVAIPTNVNAVRFVAEDQAIDGSGWVAFSEPFVLSNPVLLQGYMALQIATTFALVLTLVWVPGLAICDARIREELRPLILLGAGPLSLAAMGLAVWSMGGMLSPQPLATTLITAGWLVAGFCVWRRTFSRSVQLPVIAVSALVALSCIAKASYSLGPQGEGDRGALSRSLEVGGRLDSAISFVVVQLVGFHLSPISAPSDRYYQPWTFFSRGPLAGLMAAPICLAVAGLPPTNTMDQAWVAYDTTGFAAYRIVLIVLASGVVVALFLTLVPLAGIGWGMRGAVFLALSPFGIHEIYYTWPKWEATTWLMISFLLAHRRHGFLAGLTLGVGFLFHPLAVLWAPWIGLWLHGRSGPKSMTRIFAGGKFVVGMALFVGPWMVAGKFAPHGTNNFAAGQGGFFNYFLQTDIYPRSFGTWLKTRWMNFSNTFIPFWLYFFQDSRHPGLNAAYGPVIPIGEKFGFLWWNTLPVGSGLALWVGCMVAFFRSFRVSRGSVAILFVGPALFIVLYWGQNVTGLMRECGHPLFVSAIGWMCYQFAQSDGTLVRGFTHRLFPCLQLPETLLMMWLSTTLNPLVRQPLTQFYDTVYLTLSILALGAACLVYFKSVPPAHQDDQSRVRR